MCISKMRYPHFRKASEVCLQKGYRTLGGSCWNIFELRSGYPGVQPQRKTTFRRTFPVDIGQRLLSRRMMPHGKRAGKAFKAI